MKIDRETVTVTQTNITKDELENILTDLFRIEANLPPNTPVKVAWSERTGFFCTITHTQVKRSDAKVAASES